MENDTPQNFHNIPPQSVPLQTENRMPLSQLYEDYSYLKPTTSIPVSPPADPLNKLVLYSSGGVRRLYIYNSETPGWDYIGLNASAPGGGSAWELVSYSTDDDVDSINITGLSLAEDLKYKVYVEYDTNGIDSLFYINLDGQYQNYYTYIANANKVLLGSVSSEVRGTNASFDSRIQATTYEARSWSAEFEVHQLNNLAATGISGEVGGYTLSTGAINAHFSGFLSTNDQITSINLSVSTGSSSRQWRVWVFKPSIT